MLSMKGLLIWLLQNGEMPERSSSVSSPQLSQVTVSIRKKLPYFWTVSLC